MNTIEITKFPEESDIDILTAHISKGGLIIWKRYISNELCDRMRFYLESVSRGSLPNYHAIENGAPNFHRINDADDRATVIGRFQQFSFFPWNADPLRLFKIFGPLFQLKNILSGNSPDSFMGSDSWASVVPRLSFQYYPAGGGFLNAHSDPKNRFQVTVPTLTLTERGSDFSEGGAWVELDGEKVFTDDLGAKGDVVLFNAELPHGVDEIDPGVELDWLSGRGRWMVLLALNAVGNERAAGLAKDLVK